MPEPYKRVRSKKRTKAKSSGGRTVIHYKSGKTNFQCCSSCGRTLAGLPRQKHSEIGKLPKNQRKVGRMYSGTICHSCLKSLLRDAARSL